MNHDPFASTGPGTVVLAARAAAHGEAAQPFTPTRSLDERLEAALGISLRGQVLIAAVALAVVVVTLGQLQAFAVFANQRDAEALLQRLGPAVDTAWRAAEAPASAPRHLAGLAAGSGVERLGDVEWVEGGRRLRRHGYLFALDADAAGAPFLVAWPWEHGRSGRSAYAWSSGAGLLRHANASGRLSGPAGQPTADGVDWRAVAE